MRRSALKAIVVAVFLGTASAASATSIVSPGNGGWTVSTGGEWVKYGHYTSSTTFHSKTIADNAGRYLNDLEAAAAKGDKAAFDHAVNNLKAVEDIAKQKQDEAFKAFDPVDKEIRDAVHDEIGDPPDILSYDLDNADGSYNQANADRFHKDRDDYNARRDRAHDDKLKQRLAKDPQAKVAYDQAQRAKDDYYAMIGLVIGFTNQDTFLRIGEVAREQARQQAQPAQPAPPPLPQPKTADQGISAPSPSSACAPRPPSPLEAGVLSEINAARTDPAAYARRPRPQPYVDITEATAFLSKQAPISALTYDPCLSFVAIAHEGDQGPIGGESHTGSDGSRPSERMRAVGVQTTEYAEVISVGYATAPGVLQQLIVDQPGPLHPHRDDLFDANLAVMGVGCGPNTKFGTMCVIDLASRYAATPPPPPPP